MRFNENRDNPVKKECVRINGRSVLSLAIAPFLSFEGLGNIVVTYREGTEKEIRNALMDADIPERAELYFVKGGETRTASVRNAVLFLKEKKQGSPFIAIHDGARPFVTRSLIERTLSLAVTYGSSAPSLPLTDAIKKEKDGFVISSLDRSCMKRVQTPQIFRADSLYEVYSETGDDASYQDDIEPYVLHGGKCRLAQGDEENIKITYQGDIGKTMRIGYGNDIHRLTEGRKFVLGGTVLPFSRGEEAHSDGDVLIHAVIDAILGACALGDIGTLFPPEDDEWKDADSRNLLRAVLDKVKPGIINLDSTVTLEGFRLSPFIPQIRKSLADLMSLDITRVSVKAKTNEGLGELGSGRAVKAEAVILLSSAST